MAVTHAVGADSPGGGHSSLAAAAETSAIPLSTLRTLLRGRYIVVDGGQLTAEAREPDRKRRLHKQLRIARRLRGVMERAADEAEAARLKTSNNSVPPSIALAQSQARQTMISITPQIQELACLTEAARGGYTLDSYQELSIAALQRKETKKKQIRDATTVLRAHLVAMRSKSVPDRGTSTGKRRSVAKKSHKKMSPAAKKASLEQRQHQRWLQETGSSATAKATKLSTTPTPTHIAPNAAGTPIRNKGQKPSSSSPNSTSPPKRKGGILSAPTTLKTAARLVAAASASAATTSKKKATCLRKCHNCKVAVTQFRRCHFWFVSGTKCGKTFCKDCLTSEFDSPRADWNNAELDVDWQ